MIKNKKCILILIYLLVLNITLCSCSSNYNQKSCKNYYSSRILDNFNNNSIKKCTVVETNLYKEKTLSEKDITSLKGFFSNLNIGSYFDMGAKLPSIYNSKPCYIIFITFNTKKDEKYVINIYNSDYISVFPWDGNYEADNISMINSYSSQNLYNLCNSIIK